MHSNTLIPLAQFIEWLKLDGYIVAGINKAIPSPSTVVSKKTDDCKCYLKNSWDSDGHFSRDELIDALKVAEEFFITEANLYPAPYFICKENHSFGDDGLLRKNLYNGEHSEYKSIRPFLPCGDLIYGSAYLDEGSLSVDVVKIDELSLELLDNFTITFQVPEYITESQIRVYFSESDLQVYQERPPEFNDHLYEIRPLKSILIEDLDLNDDMLDVTITIPAYLLVKPIYEEITECLSFDEDNFVDTVDIYFEFIDFCNQGRFICSSGKCGSQPCSKIDLPLCLEEKTIYKEKWVVPKPYSCETIDNVQQNFESYCLNCIPKDVEINYVTGIPLDCIHKLVSNNYFYVIAKLALVFLDCIKNPCDCDVCFNNKLKYYRQYPVAKEREGDELGEFGDYWKIMVDKIGLKYADGLNPTRGMIEAMREIYTKMKCQKTEGVVFG